VNNSVKFRISFQQSSLSAIRYLEVSMVPPCEKHEELLVQAQSILNKIHETMRHQSGVLNAEGVSHQFLHYDRELENLMGEKERAVGALREHDEEHGCQNRNHRAKSEPNVAS
jgi:hypothetical protein